MKNLNLKKINRGFTLIELMVSATIFSLILIIATGALFSTQAINSRIGQTQLILDGVNLSLDVMGRDIRYGSRFYCSTSVFNGSITYSRGDCSQGGQYISFRPAVKLSGSTDSSYDRVVYYVYNQKIYKNEYPYNGTPRIFQITPDDVSVKSLNLKVIGAETIDNGDLRQPLISILMSGVTIPQRSTVNPVSFNLESTISPRTLDI